ncbi:hypothetical protein OE88DRAFT_1803452 [Heliocybe sulcata]|uniref:Uncharacterized protein n=1 Tax=Heliocybe sulcata TaxID=5364 RepID=A0A5C3NKY2_9AGAM|nr:hypothetical protein OE88DRAFT_1803452 [Heliocybe sulcata]
MNLPPELVLQIFRWATWPPPHIKFSAEYHPFSCSNMTVPVDDHRVELKLKYNLALVSRQWRNLSSQFLYEHITFGRGSDDVIVPSASWLKTTGYGRYAMSVQICHSLSGDEPLSDSYEVWMPILDKCPNVQLIMRPWWAKAGGTFITQPSEPSPSFSAPTMLSEPSCLANVTRLEWEYSVHFNIRLFHDTVLCLPNLLWLSVTSIVGAGTGGRALQTVWRNVLHLPQLTTLCLRIENAMMYRISHRWTLPKLTNLIIEEQDVSIGGTNVRIMRALFEKLGQTLEVLELGRGKYKHFRQSDLVSLAVSLCPKLHILSIFALYTMVPAATHTAIAAKSLRHVHLHAEVAPGDKLPLESTTKHMRRHIEWFRQYEELEYLTLHGDWSDILKDPGTSRALANTKLIVKSENGTAWP